MKHLFILMIAIIMLSCSEKQEFTGENTVINWEIEAYRATIKTMDSVMFDFGKIADLPTQLKANEVYQVTLYDSVYKYMPSVNGSQDLTHWEFTEFRTFEIKTDVHYLIVQ